MSETQIHDEQERYLTFRLGAEAFAIPLLDVKEVIALPEVTPIPQTPPYFIGIMNLRGQVITVIDLRLKLGIKATTSTETAVIICNLDPYSVGVVVDSADHVLAAAKAQINSRPDLIGARSDSISGVYQENNELVLLLDLPKVLSLQDHATVKRAQQSGSAAA